MSDVNVDQGLASWLQSEALFADATDGLVAGRWGSRATITEIISSLAFEDDATAEAGRQLSFLEGPLAKDEHIVPGMQSNLIGTLVELSGPDLGYEAGAVVFVLGAVESENANTTQLTVLYRLGST